MDQFERLFFKDIFTGGLMVFIESISRALKEDEATSQD